MTFKSGDNGRESADAGKNIRGVGLCLTCVANDAALVKRVRVFLCARIFTGHERLARTGADIDVVQALMDIGAGRQRRCDSREADIRRRCADCLAAEEARIVVILGRQDTIPRAMRGVKERYLAQMRGIVRRMSPWATSRRSRQPQPDVHARGGSDDPLGRFPRCRADWISNMDCPILSNWGRKTGGGGTSDIDLFQRTRDGTRHRSEIADPFGTDEGDVSSDDELESASTGHRRRSGGTIGFTTCSSARSAAIRRHGDSGRGLVFVSVRQVQQASREAGLLGYREREGSAERPVGTAFALPDRNSQIATR